jgi:hypothetical protein
MEVAPKQFQQDGATIGQPMLYTANGWAPQPPGVAMALGTGGLSSQGSVSIQNGGSLSVADTGQGAVSYFSQTLKLYGHKSLVKNTLTTLANLQIFFGGNFNQCIASGEIKIRWSINAGLGADPNTGGAAGAGAIPFAAATTYAGANNLNTSGYASSSQVVINSSDITFSSVAFSIVSSTPGLYILQAKINATIPGAFYQMLVDWDASIAGSGYQFNAA